MMIKDLLVLIILIFATIQDLKYREVSNLASLFILIISFYKFNCINILGLFISPLPLVLTNLIKQNSFGGADIKIIASLGLCYGIKKSMLILFIALILCMLSNIKNQEKRAFIPYILIGYIITCVLWRMYGS